MFQPFLVIFSKFHHQNYNYVYVYLSPMQNAVITPEQPQQQLCSEM
jgi:hypothetical protein